MSTASDDEHDPPAPFLVQLFYRTGAFHRPEEFATPSLPPHISVYTWSHCTLSELAMELAAAKPSALPYPAVGTRLAFQLVYPDMRNAGTGPNAPPRFAVKDLGSIILGQGLPGSETGSEVGDTSARADHEIGRTLSDARFVVGDYVSCAVLPPLSDGAVAPASNARPVAPTMRDNRAQRGGLLGRENGFGRGGGRGGRGGRRDGPGTGFPMGEWRRGETLPAGPSGRGGRGGRW